jgi:hypothetical protein
MAAYAADFHPLDVKTGEWEATLTSQASGELPIPPEALARMTPQQRARFEERIKNAGSRPRLRRSCVTQDKLDKPLMWGQDDKACTYTLVKSTSSVQEIHVECSRETNKSSGTVRIEAMNSENVKGSVEMAVTANERTMNINSSFTAKWVGAVCSKRN